MWTFFDERFKSQLTNVWFRRLFLSARFKTSPEKIALISCVFVFSRAQEIAFNASAILNKTYPSWAAANVESRRWVNTYDIKLCRQSRKYICIGSLVHESQHIYSIKVGNKKIKFSFNESEWERYATKYAQFPPFFSKPKQSTFIYLFFQIFQNSSLRQKREEKFIWKKNQFSFFFLHSLNFIIL